jgi:putative hemolysin/membrane-bound inhibitor of C-type lysozyme
MRFLHAVAAALVAFIVTHADAQTTLANPASQNCAAKGGKLTIEKKPNGGQFGVCLFDDNMQCEEWSMLRGQCRTGGIKVTGFSTAAGRYCAITGGTYKVVSASNTPDEKGTCSFAGGKTCDAAAYFDGTCAPQPVGNVTRAAPPAKTIAARFDCAGGKWIDATFINGPKSSVRLALSDGRKLSLPQAMSGSGARYANADDSFVFWTKGNTAFVEEKGKTTFEDCATKA